MLFVSRKAVVSSPHTPSLPPPLPPCFTSNIFLNHLRGKTRRFVRRCRRFMALCPQCGVQAFIHLWCSSAACPRFNPPIPCRRPHASSGTWHQHREASLGGARALDQICVKYAYEVGWKCQRLVRLDVIPLRAWWREREML